MLKIIDINAASGSGLGGSGLIYTSVVGLSEPVNWSNFILGGLNHYVPASKKLIQRTYCVHNVLQNTSSALEVAYR